MYKRQLADEIEVFPSTVLKATPDNIPFAFAFAIPIATKGLRLICRDSYDLGKSNFDAPLSSRYEEMDAVVIFDNVLVPWERIFMYGEPELCNPAFSETNAVVHMMHQVACGKLAKAEFMVGLLSSIVKASGRDNDLYSKGLIAEVMQMTETKNGNGRKYQHETMVREVKNYQKVVEEKRALGELDHPDDSVVNLKEGTNITLTQNSATEIEIAAAGGSSLPTKTVDQTTIANATTGTINLSVTPSSENYTDMYVSGVYQNKSTYTLSSNTITLDGGAYFPNGAIVEVVSTT